MKISAISSFKYPAKSFGKTDKTPSVSRTKFIENGGIIDDRKSTAQLKDGEHYSGNIVTQLKDGGAVIEKYEQGILRERVSMFKNDDKKAKGQNITIDEYDRTGNLTRSTFRKPDGHGVIVVHTGIGPRPIFY